MIPTNLRGKPKHKLIKIVRSMHQSIKTNCYDCMGGQKKVDCKLTHCSLYKLRPWAKNINNSKDS